jgi:hypothetical protein
MKIPAGVSFPDYRNLIAAVFEATAGETSGADS